MSFDFFFFTFRPVRCHGIAKSTLSLIFQLSLSFRLPLYDYDSAFSCFCHLFFAFFLLWLSFFSMTQSLFQRLTAECP